MEPKIQVQRISTKAVITNEKNQVLILRESKGHEGGVIAGKYVLPGGRLELGEHHLDGLKREVSEETGLEVHIGEPVLIGEWRPVIRGVPNQIVCIFFACQAVTTSVKLSEEHDAFEWIKPEDVSKFSFAACEREAIEAWNNKNNQHEYAHQMVKEQML